MSRLLVITLVLGVFVVGTVFGQETPSHDKNLDVQSPMGDLHVGKDADAQKAGLPLYPGARASHEQKNDPLNLGIFTESFGLKLVVAKYESDDPSEKIIAFYHEKMRKYGTVLECRGQKDDNSVHTDDHQDVSKPLKCEGDNTGPVRELKVGTEGNAHVVEIEPHENGKGTAFTLVYVHQRKKSGEI